MGDQEKLKLTKRQRPEDERRGAAKAVPVPVEPDADFIHIEKQIIAAGFFTPTSKELKTTRVKTVHFKRTNEQGEARETRIKIVTGGYYGLPGTGDLDKWLALQKLINNIQRKAGVVTNPISFSSWELLSMLGFHKKSGRNYEGVSEFLDRMVATTIEVSGEGIIDGQRRFGKDRIKVFERAVSFGRELEKGVIADRNYIWLSDWQLENINASYLLSVDFETYRALKNPTAKTLVPLLQIWLYASRGGSVFSKRYEDVCQLLGIKQWKQKSRIEEKLGPALDELRKYGYIAGWGIEKLRGTEGYKLILRHGEKYFRDQAENQRRQGQLTGGETDSEDDEKWVSMLIERGVAKTVALQLVTERAPGQQIEDQIEWFDYQLEKKGTESFTNAPGLLVTLIRTNAPIDPNFETSRMRRLRAAYEASRRAHQPTEQEEQSVPDVSELTTGDDLPPREPSEHDRYLLENNYREYVRREIASHIKKLPPDEYEALMERARIQFQEEYREAAKVFKKPFAEGVIMGLAEKIIAPEVKVLSYEEFSERQGQ